MWMQIKQSLCFKQKGAISTLSCKTLNLVRPVQILCQQHLIYWKWCQHLLHEGIECYWQVSNHKEICSTQKNKMVFLTSCSRIHTTIWLHHMLIKYREKKAWLEQKCCVVSWTNPGNNTLQNSSCMAILPLTSQNLPSKTNNICRSLLKK